MLHLLYLFPTALLLTYKVYSSTWKQALRKQSHHEVHLVSVLDLWLCHMSFISNLFRSILVHFGLKAGVQSPTYWWRSCDWIKVPEQLLKWPCGEQLFPRWWMNLSIHTNMDEKSLNWFDHLQCHDNKDFFPGENQKPVCLCSYQKKSKNWKTHYCYKIRCCDCAEIQ